MSPPPDRRLAAAPWLTAPETRRLLALLGDGGAEIRFVGGCVRDSLLQPDQDVTDLDLATPLLPDEVSRRLRAAKVRVIPTGIEHGTVTAHLDDRHYEITTLRHDVETDGRHAVVAFTDDFAADAARRDFTINAMSVDPDGLLHDYFGGLADLAAGRVRFVGDPVQRIREDYLRILRFFRFHARFGGEVPDAAALAACAGERAGIARLSPERVRTELLRLLASLNPGPALRLMDQAGVLAMIIPVPASIERLERLVTLAPASDPLLRLACLIRPPVPDAGPARLVAAGLRLSNAEARRLEALCAAPLPPIDAEPVAHRHGIYEQGAALHDDLLALAAACTAAGPERLAAALATAAAETAPRFPLTGADLLARGFVPGPALGHALDRARHFWEAADFAPDRAACLAFLDLAEPSAPAPP